MLLIFYNNILTADPCVQQIYEMATKHFLCEVNHVNICTLFAFSIVIKFVMDSKLRETHLFTFTYFP